MQLISWELISWELILWEDTGGLGDTSLGQTAWLISSSMATTLNSDLLDKEHWLECVLSTKEWLRVSLSLLPTSLKMVITIRCYNNLYQALLVTRVCGVVCVHVGVVVCRVPSFMYPHGRVWSKGLHFPVIVAQSGYTIMCGPYTYGYVLSPCIGYESGSLFLFNTHWNWYSNWYNPFDHTLSFGVGGAGMQD